MARIGNRRNACSACNRFAQAARRLTYQQFLAQFPEEYAALRLKIELALYPNVLEQFLNDYPAARETPGTAQEETPDATPRT